jgi:pilus assembly protein CpaB
MRQRNFIFVVLAVFLTVGTIYIARSWLAAQHVQAVQEPARPAQQGVSVLVAAHDLATGSFVRPEDLRWQAWPEGQIADNYLLKDKDAPESLSGAVIKLRIAAGEPVTSNRVIKPGDRGFLAAVLSPGMRAVSVPVTPISDISGLVFPGDHVDLILSHQVKIISQKQGDASGGTSDSSAFVSETIQTDLRILAIDQSMGDVEGKPMLGRTVTFEVTPQQVEAIEVSSMVGTLYLSLRGLAGSDTMAGDGVAGEELTPHGVRSVSHTWDSDVSPFITREGGAMNVVTILRGETKAGGGGSTSVNAAPSAAPATTPPNPGGPAAPNQGGSAPARTTSGP